MKSGYSFLPIAVALGACFWVADAMAQPVTMPAAGSEAGRPAAHAGIATHDTGELPGTGDRPDAAERPGTGDRPGAGNRPGAGERPGIAQPAAGTALDPAASLRQQALAAMETLRREIATLTALKYAQAALLAWNRGRTEGGEAPVFLADTLCNERAIGAWCRLLPATFGTGGRPGTPHTPSGGSTPSGVYTEDGHDRD